MKALNKKGLQIVHSLVHQFISVLTNRGLQRIVNLLIVIILARLMTVVDYGTYGVFITTITLAATLGAMGLQEAIAFLIGRNPQKASLFLAGGLLLLLPLGALATIAAVFWLDLATDPGIMFWIVPVLLAISGRLLLFWAQGNALGTGNIKDFNISESFPIALLFFGTLAVIPYGEIGLLYIIWLYGLAHFVIGLWYVQKTYRTQDTPFKPLISEMIEILRQGAPYAFSMFLAIANNTIALYLLRAKGLDEAVAYYFISWQIFNALLNIANALGMVLFSHSARSEDPIAVFRDVSRFTSLLLWFMLLMGMAAAIVSPWLIPLVFGQSYTEAVPFIQIIMLSMGFVSLTRIMYRTLGGLGMPYISTSILIPALIVNAVTSWFLIDALGAHGAVVGLFISQLLIITSYLVLIRIKFGLAPWMFLFPKSADIKAALAHIKETVRKQQ